MKDTKTEFLLKKLLYYKIGFRRKWPDFSKDMDDQYELENNIPEKDVESEPENEKPDIDVAPLSVEDKLKISEHKLFRRMERYGFNNITLSKCKVAKIVEDDKDGERFFAHLSKQKFGRIDRNLANNGSMSVKFIFNKETVNKYYGEGGN